MAVLLVVPVLLWFRDDPGRPRAAAARRRPGTPIAPAPPPDPGVMRRAVRSVDFWFLASTFFVCGATSNGLIGQHFIATPSTTASRPSAAAGALALMGAFNFVGTIASGWLTDRFDPRKLLLVYYGFRGVSLLFLPFVHDSMGIVAFSVLFGLDYIATVPPTVMLVRRTGSAGGTSASSTAGSSRRTMFGRGGRGVGRGHRPRAASATTRRRSSRRAGSRSWPGSRRWGSGGMASPRRRRRPDRLARRMTQVFRTLALIYLGREREMGRARARPRSQRVMTRRSATRSHAVLGRVPAAVSAWSEGNAGPRSSRHRRGAAAADVALARRGRPLVGRPARRPPGGRRVQRGRPVRLDLRALAVRRPGPALWLGLHDRPVARRPAARGSRRSHRTTGRRWRPIPTPSRATSTSGCTRSRGRTAALGCRGGPAAGAARRAPLVVPRRRERAVRAAVQRLPRRWRQDLAALVSRLDDGPGSPARRRRLLRADAGTLGTARSVGPGIAAGAGARVAPAVGISTPFQSTY